MKCKQLLDHFQQFGEVVDIAVRHRTKDTSAVAIVMFKKAEDAMKAISEDQRLFDENVHISAAIQPVVSQATKKMRLRSMPDGELDRTVQITPIPSNVRIIFLNRSLTAIVI